MVWIFIVYLLPFERGEFISPGQCRRSAPLDATRFPEGRPTVSAVTRVIPISLELVLSGRDLTEPRLSPDGGRVAFAHRWRGASAINVVDVGGGPERIITFGPEPATGRGLGGGCFDWLPDGSGLVHAATDGELWRVVGTAVDRLTTHERTCQAPATGTGRGGATLVAYVVDEAEVWLLDADSRTAERVDDGRHEFCFDPVIAPDGSVVSWQGWSPPAMPWDAAERVDRALDTVTGRPGSIESWRPEGGAVQQPRFAADGTPTCVHDGEGWLAVHVAGTPVAADEIEPAGPTWGMGQRSYAVGADGDVVAAINDRGFGSVCCFRADGTRTVLSHGFTGVFGHLSLVGPRLVALRSGPTTPSEIVAWDVDDPSPARVLVTSGAIGWSDVSMPDPEPVVVERDGGALHGRRYVAGNGRMLCWIHGGPTDQWQVDFRPRVVYWWSRGWDVLVVDPRGTTGHGRSYQQALNGGWGRIDVDDTAALLRHAHVAGWATPERTVVLGGSSGGLTVLGVMADHPDLVAAGIASYPVSDLAALAAATHRFEAHYTDTLVGRSGDPATDRLLRSLSPIDRAERITSPLLVFHGSDDPVVPIAQTEVLVERIRAGGGNVDFVVYEGEGHGFRDPVNQRDEYERTERFLGSF